MSNVDSALTTALQIAIQQARAEQAGATELTGSVVQPNAFGPGIHSVVIDGDTDATAAPAHSVCSAFLNAGTRVAMLAVKPHQVWIIGELSHAADAVRVWASVNTNFAVLNTPVAITFDNISYDYLDQWDAGNNQYPITQDGLYQISYRWITTGAVTGARFRGELYDASTGTPGDLISQGLDAVADSAQRIAVQGTDTLFLQAGQIIAPMALQAAGTLAAVDGAGTTGPGERVYFTLRRL